MFLLNVLICSSIKHLNLPSKDFLSTYLFNNFLNVTQHPITSSQIRRSLASCTTEALKIKPNDNKKKEILLRAIYDECVFSRFQINELILCFFLRCCARFRVLSRLLLRPTIIACHPRTRPQGEKNFAKKALLRFTTFQRAPAELMDVDNAKLCGSSLWHRISCGWSWSSLSEARKNIDGAQHNEENAAVLGFAVERRRRKKNIPLRCSIVKVGRSISRRCVAVLFLFRVRDHRCDDCHQTPFNHWRRESPRWTLLARSHIEACKLRLIWRFFA